MATAKKRALLVEWRSPLQAAALAVLLEGPTYGYEVAKRINRRMGVSWRLQAKHIYPVLRELERAGLIRSEEQEVKGPLRSQRFYYPTERAVQARRDWMDTPPASSVLRADIHARLAFSSQQDVPGLLRALSEVRMDLLEEMEENAAMETPRVSWRGTVMSLCRSAVDRRLKAEVEWVEEACRALEEFAGERGA
jgi:DNA-binding PadR family transcriptional regulator